MQTTKSKHKKSKPWTEPQGPVGQRQKMKVCVTSYRDCSEGPVASHTGTQAMRTKAQQPVILSEPKDGRPEASEEVSFLPRGRLPGTVRWDVLLMRFGAVCPPPQIVKPFQAMGHLPTVTPVFRPLVSTWDEDQGFSSSPSTEVTNYLNLTVACCVFTDYSQPRPWPSMAWHRGPEREAEKGFKWIVAGNSPNVAT